MTTIQSSDIEVVLKGIWTSVLGKDLMLTDSASEGDVRVDAKLDPAHISSCVQITGDWQGAVMIDCLGPTARKIAAAMFGMDAATISNDEIRDAVGEIANMAGGNLKPLLGGSCQLSLPTVAVGGDFRQMVPGTRAVSQAVFNSEDGELAVTILAKD